MKFLFRNHFENARESLRANRGRTFLTITGVAIGIASIVAILSLATGASRIIVEQVDEIGGTIAVIRPGTQAATSLDSFVNQQTHASTAPGTLTLSDAKHVRSLSSVTAAAPLQIANNSLQADGKSLTNQTIIGTTEELLTISNVPVRDGQFTDTDSPLITIGPQLAINLFGTEDVLGKTITLRNKEFRVAGVLERQHNKMNFNGIDFNTAALLTSAQFTALYPASTVQQITVQADSVAHLDQVAIAINKSLLERHGNEQDFTVLTGSAISEPTSQLFFIIAGVTAAIAGISLFVGGIGIMNIMLVNVAERTREIGIRKALGATHSDIVWQFLIESVLMSLLGGIIGGLGGLGLAFVVSLFLTFDPVITWQAAVATIGVSAAIGVLFGIYPALRAAQKDPIESLKQQQ